MNVIYNHTERRLRAFWRIALQMVLHLLGVGLVSIAAALVIVAVAALTGQISLGQNLSLPELQSTINELAAAQPELLIVQRSVMTVLILLLYALIARFLDRRPLKEYGLRLNPVWWRDLGFGLVLGAVLMSLLFGFERLMGWVQVTGRFYTSNSGAVFESMLLFSLVHYIWIGVSEELFSRGYQMRNIAEGLNLPAVGPRAAVLISYIITSSIFGFLHLGNPNATLLSALNLALAGLMLGMGMALTGSLAIPIGLHITWNFFQGSIFGLPVSGGTPATSLLAVEQTGLAFWTGGAFGPEGGMLGVLAVLLGLLISWAYIRLTRGQAALHTELAVYRPNKPDSTPAGQPLAPAKPNDSPTGSSSG